jgi:hypothetical protein
MVQTRQRQLALVYPDDLGVLILHKLFAELNDTLINSGT